MGAQRWDGEGGDAQGVEASIQTAWCLSAMASLGLSDSRHPASMVHPAPGMGRGRRILSGYGALCTWGGVREVGHEICEAIRIEFQDFLGLSPS